MRGKPLACFHPTVWGKGAAESRWDGEGLRDGEGPRDGEGLRDGWLILSASH